jgi:hypothetical protein
LRDSHSADAELVAVIHCRRAAQRQQQHGGNARLRFADARRDTRLIVVSQNPVRPAAGWQSAFVVRHQLADRRRGPRRMKQLEIERQLRAAQILSVIGHQPFDRQIDLADQHALVILIENKAHLGDNLVRLGLIGAVNLHETMNAGFVRAVVRIRRIVAQRGILDQQPDDVDAKSVDTAVEPEAQDIVHRRAHGRVAPVEVRLLG